MTLGMIWMIRWIRTWKPFLGGFEGLQDASGLDTTPEMEFESPSGIPSAEASAYHMTVRKAAELLDLNLPHEGNEE